MDKSGEPYFKHVQSVDKYVSNINRNWNEEYDDLLVEAGIVSYLHNVIEDTSHSIRDLWDIKIPTNCISVIEYLTKKDGQDYWEYLKKIEQYKLAAVVKIADMTHNSDLSRLPEVAQADIARREKSLKAIDYLSSFTCEKFGLTGSISLMGEKSTRIGEIVCKLCLENYEISHDEYEDWINSL